jgi:hypothetical protein
MNLRRALLVAACTVPFAAGAAHAQFPQQPPQEPPCVQAFGKLRDATQQKALAIRQASQRKASPKEACHLFTAFTAAEEKMLKYAVDNAAWCGIPPQVIDNIKKGHAQSNEMRIKICRVAAAPPRPAGPSLSDALGGPIPDANNIKTGRGTFDTLTGSPLGK